MKLNETTLPFLELDCIQQFGQEKGKLIFAKPNQIRHSILPFRACFIHFTTESEEFKNRLNSIKNTYYLPDYKALAEMFYEITAVSGDSFSDRLYIQSIS